MGLYPGGNNTSDDRYVAIYLVKNTSDESIKIQYSFSVRDEAGREVVHRSKPKTYEFKGIHGKGYSNFAKLSVLMDALVEGALIVEIRMKLIESTFASQFIPENPINKNILNKFNDEESSDVIFEVDDQSGDARAGKRAKTTTTFYAHRFILHDGASTLAEMCKQTSGGEATTSVSITDVKPEIFRHMLYYLYGGKLIDEDLKENAKDIINACDKYGVVSLKLEAEVSYVKSTMLTNDNIIDNLCTLMP